MTLLTQSAKYMLSIFETKYKIDISIFKEKIKNNISISGKKLIKIEHIYEIILKYPEYKQILFQELLVLPIYIPIKIESVWYINSKKINSYLVPFDINIDYDVKEVISNILYLFIYYIHNNFTVLQIPNIIEHYILRLISIDCSLKKDIITLQELILRSLLVEIAMQNYKKLIFFDFIKFINQIENQILKEIINLSFETYKNILLNC